MKTVKNILLIPNLDKENSVECLNAAVRRLAELGFTPLLDEAYESYIREKGCMTGPFLQLLHGCNMLMPIGGDGTILRCVPHAVAVDVPILGINTGRVGFLSQMEACEVQHLDRLTGMVEVEQRMLLELELPGSDGVTVKHTVLNDIVMAHENNKLVDLVVRDEHRQIARHRANGVIFATPTGSTAYSLSAGGCIADPTMSAVLMTAVCPYSAYNRSFVLPAQRSYTVRMDQGSTLYLSADGERVGEVVGNQEVTVRRSRKTVGFVDLGLRDFYSNLNDKLSLRR